MAKVNPKGMTREELQAFAQAAKRKRAAAAAAMAEAREDAELLRSTDIFKEDGFTDYCELALAESAIAERRASLSLFGSITAKMGRDADVVNEDGTPTAKLIAAYPDTYQTVVAWVAAKKRNESANGADSTVVEAVATIAEA